MGSVISYIECPHCGSEDCHEDYYYKTDEMYQFCEHCGYSYQQTIINRKKRLSELTEDDWEIVENKLPYAAFKVKMQNSIGYTVGSLNSKEQLDRLIEEYKDIEGIEYLKISRFDGKEVTKTTIFDNGPLFDSAGFTNNDNEV